MKNEFELFGLKYRKTSEPIKSGGNGFVIFISCKSSEKKYAVKFFNAKKFEPKENDSDIKKEDRKKKLQERFQRFKQEIKFAKKNKIEGIIPVIDYECPEHIDYSDDAYYIMPKAELIDFQNYSILKILKTVFQLAQTLKVIHEKGYAHRDIKPENILLYNGKPCFCDFGLIWEESNERLTVVDERVGPSKIMPPELEHVDPNIYVDYKYSDIYLLAKVLWIYLTGNNDGFKGQYIRSEEKIYLPFLKQKKVMCFEPIHTLLEDATKDCWNERININKFIDLLSSEIAILEDRFSGDISKLNYLTKVKKMYYCGNVSSKRFFYYQEICNYILSIFNDTKLKIYQNSSFILLNPLNINVYKNEIIMNCKLSNETLEIHMNPMFIEIDSNFKTLLVMNEYQFTYKQYEELNVLKVNFGNGNIFYLSENHKIEFIN